MTATAAPKGWELLARLGELPDRECLECGAPAIVGTPDGFRCEAHPPTVENRGWGARLDWTPKPGVGTRDRTVMTGVLGVRRLPVPPAMPGCRVGRCYCGRCSHYRRFPS